MPATFTIPSVFTAVDKFSRPMYNMSTAVSGFAARSEAALSRVDRVFRGLMAPLNNFKRLLNSIGLYLGIWLFIRAAQVAVGVMADFEQANVNIATVIEKKELPMMSAMAMQARTLAVNYGVAAKSVSELQYELLKMGNSAKTVLAMTDSIVTGAVAMRTTPERMAEVAGAIFKGFKLNLEGAGGADLAKSYIDKLALAANLTAADFESYATQLPIITSVANLANVDYEKVLAMLGVTRDLQIHTATASTSIKNMMLDIVVKQKKTFDEAIGAINKIATKEGTLIYAFDKYGKKTVVTAAGLKESWARVEEIYAKLKDPAQFMNYAQGIASQQLLSTRGHLKLLNAAYQELILTIDDGNGGPISTAIKHYSNIVSAMLLLTSGSEAANSRLSVMDKTVIDSARSALKWLSVIMQIIKWLVILKVVIIAARVALFVYNVALGIAAALGWANVFALRASIVAMTVFRAIMATVTAAQWLWNAAMAANPIGLIIAAIIALIAWGAVLVNNYNEWGAAAAMLSGGLGLILNIVMSIMNKWDAIKLAFTSGGMLEGIYAIGIAIYDAILYPIQQLLEILGKINGPIGAAAASGAASLQSYREDLGAERMNTNDGKNSSDSTSTTNNNVRLDVFAPAGSRVSGSDPSINIRPQVSSTHGWSGSW